jgi:DNA-binding NarL/FixJ family response regulator
MANQKILVVEDELITAENIASFLEEEDFMVMETAMNAQEALSTCSLAKVPPAVVICDINLRRGMSGIELSQMLIKQYACEVVFLSAYSDIHTLKAAFDTNPAMYVSKPYHNKQLLIAVHMAFHRYLQKQKEQPKISINISVREKEIVDLVAEGNSSKIIADKLSISVETVKSHRRNILKRHGLNNFSQLIYLLSKERAVNL